MLRLRSFVALVVFAFVAFQSAFGFGGDYILRAQYITPYQEWWNPYVMMMADMNQNGLTEIYSSYFSSDSSVITIKEVYTDFTYENLQPLPFYGIPWDWGDINNNGLKDMVVQSGNPATGDGYVLIYEQKVPGGFPDNLICKMTFPGAKTIHFSQYVDDMDGDGKPEILFSPNVPFGGGGVYILEWDSSGDSLKISWSQDFPEQFNHMAVGDFNGNGRMEIVAVSLGSPNVRVFENIADNSYEKIFDYTYPVFVYEPGPAYTINYDGNSAEEFLVSFSTGVGFRYLIFEWNGDTYSVKYDLGDQTGLFGLTIGLICDFDNDGRDEFVASVQPETRIYDFNPNNPEDGEWEYEMVNNTTGRGYFSADFNNNGYRDMCLAFFNGDSALVRIYESKDASTGIVNENRKSLLSRFTLSQNYPNPFNTRTVIDYSIPISAFVEIEIYNINGRKIKEISEKKSAGNYKYIFNADGLASGTYFYRLKLNGKILQTKKMIFIK